MRFLSFSTSRCFIHLDASKWLSAPLPELRQPAPLLFTQRGKKSSSLTAFQFAFMCFTSMHQCIALIFRRDAASLKVSSAATDRMNRGVKQALCCRQSLSQPFAIRGFFCSYVPVLIEGLVPGVLAGYVSKADSDGTVERTLYFME